MGRSTWNPNEGIGTCKEVVAALEANALAGVLWDVIERLEYLGERLTTLEGGDERRGPKSLEEFRTNEGGFLTVPEDFVLDGIQFRAGDVVWYKPGNEEE
jgi:hypothetical protein